MSAFKLFQSSQRSSAGHKKSAKLLWGLQQQDSDGTFDDVTTCLKHILVFSQVRVVREGEKLYRKMCGRRMLRQADARAPPRRDASMQSRVPRHGACKGSPG